MQVVGEYWVTKYSPSGDINLDFKKTNIIPTQQLNQLITNLFLTGGISGLSWLFAPFINNYTPVASDTGVTMKALAGEFTAYKWLSDGTTSSRSLFRPTFRTSSLSVDNYDEPETIQATSSGTIYGISLQNTGSKSSTGILLSAAKFSNPISVLTNECIDFRYRITALSG